MQVRKDPYKIKTFHPLQISISVKGGSMLDYSIERRDSCKMIGIERNFTYDETFQNIPEFGAEYKRNLEPLCIRELNGCCIGMYGVSIDGEKSEKSFRYLIAGEYHNEIIPESFKIIEIPSLTFAKFICTGPMPEAIQAVNIRIFNEWLSGNEEYEISAGYNIE